MKHSLGHGLRRLDKREGADSIHQSGDLAKRYAELERIEVRSERYFSDDLIISLITIRRFGEVLAQLTAAGSSPFADAAEAQSDLLRRLRVGGNFPRNVLDLFHPPL